MRAAEFEFEAEPPLLADIVFHAQQLAEKALKAFLTWHDVPFRKTHDLSDLSQQCTDIDASLGERCRPVERLTSYAWMFRYPGERVEPTRAEAELSLGEARALHVAVPERLPTAVRP